MQPDGPILDPATGQVRMPDEHACPYCAQAMRELVAAEHETRAVERDLRKIRADRDRLRTELSGQKKRQASYEVAHAIGRYWIGRCAKDPKRTKLGEKRLDKVQARLKDYDPYYIARAIDGLAVYHFVDERGTHHNDLELVCRDEIKLEKYWQLAYDHDAPTQITRLWLGEWGLPVNFEIHELLADLDESHTTPKEKVMPQYDDNMRGVLFKHDKNGNEKAPEYKGKCEINGQEYSLSAWIRTASRDGSKFMSLSFDLPQGAVQQAAPANAAAPAAPQQGFSDSEIPF